MKLLVLLGFLFFICTAHAASGPRLGPPLEQQIKLPVKDTSAETLYSQVTSELFTDGAWQRRIYTSIRINDLAAARDYGRISIPYNHYYTDVTLEFAHTYNKRGQLVEVAADAIQTRVTGGGQDFYSDSSELVFSLPDIAPGSVVEFQYVKTSREIPMAGLYVDMSTPFWYQNTVGQDGWRADFVHRYRQTLITPQSTPLFVKTFVGHPPAKQQRTDDGKTMRTWQMQNVNGLVSEGYMPHGHEVVPMALISTVESWSAVDAWTWAKVVDKLTPTPALKSVVASLNLKPDASAEQKIQAVYAYLQGNIRYVFAHLGRGGYEPHEPGKVINNSYGDCKDQAVLSVALLRLLGVEAYPALIETPRGGNSDTSVVRLIFDHMIVHIPPQAGATTQWLDTTSDRALYPGISAYLANQNVLIVNGEGGQLTRFPAASKNLAEVNIQMRRDDKGVATAVVEIAPQGMFEQNIRHWWKHTQDRDNAFKQYLKGLYNNTSNAEVSGEVVHAEDLFTPVKINARYTFKPEDAEEEHVFGASAHQLFRLFADQSGLPDPASRRYPFRDDYPFELHLHLEMENGLERSPVVVRTVDDQNTPWFSLTYKGQAQESKYVLDINFTRQALKLSLPQYAQYFAATEKLIQSDTWLVKMLADPGKERQQSLLASADINGETSQTYLLDLARQLIAEGEFDKALAPARKAVDANKTNGEAWYVLATAQGLNTLIDESEKSYQRAAELGYFPQ